MQGSDTSARGAASLRSTLSFTLCTRPIVRTSEAEADEVGRDGAKARSLISR